MLRLTRRPFESPSGLKAALVFACGLAPAVAFCEAPPSLSELSAPHRLRIGTAVKAGPLAEDASYRAVLLR